MGQNNTDIELDIVKKPHTTSEYTGEALADLLRCVDDPLFFIRRFVKIQHALRGAVPFEPYPFQIDLIRAFHENRFSIALTARQMGKALALDTPIPTPTGWTTMGDIRVGDKVLGDDGLPTTVTFATDVMVNHDCYEVEFDNGEVVVADAEHLWRVEFSPQTRIKAADVLTTEQIIPLWEKSRRYGQGVRIKLSAPIEGREQELPIPPYTFGVWLGDGNSNDGRFCGHRDDCEEMRSYVAADGFEMSEIKRDPRNNVCFQTVYGLRGKLVAAGVFGKKHIPATYMRASVEQRLELLRGLMDTDGSAVKTGGMEFYQKDAAFARQVFELIASLGMKPRLTTKVVKGETYHKVRFCTTQQVFKLARKRALVENVKGHPKNTHFYIKDIRKVASVPVRCIQVDNPQHMFLCGRSMIPTHNTTCAAAFLLWKAMFTPDTTILIVANKFVQAMEIMTRIKYAYENLPNHIRAGVTKYNESEIKFDNGSRIVSRATSSDAGRGLSITLLYMDEFAFVPPNKATEFFTSIQPVLSTGGSCIITSTPKSDEDQFAQIWKGAIDKTDEYGNETETGVGRNGFFPVKVKWDAHPERDETWAKPYREQLGPARFAQEFECEFVTDDETLINPMTLSRLKGIEPIYYTGTVRWFKEPEPGKVYLAALDPSLGTGGDYAAIEVFELPGMIQVAEWQHNETVTKGQVRILMQTLVYIDAVVREQGGDPEIYWTIENNTLGESILNIIEDTGEDRFPGMFLSERKRKGQVRRFRKGFNTDNRKKLSACARLKSLAESDRMVVNSNQLLKELKTFVSKETSFSAKPGTHDDLVSSTLLIVRMLEVVATMGAEVGDIREHISDSDVYGEEMVMVI